LAFLYSLKNQSNVIQLKKAFDFFDVNKDGFISY